MATIEHCCARCNFWSMDNERLHVCPQCSSSEITNHNDEEVDFKNQPEGEPEINEEVF